MSSGKSDSKKGLAWCTTWSSDTEGWQLNIPREGGGDPQLQRGTASQWDKNGKKSRNGLLSAFLCFFAHYERTDTNCALFTHLYFCTAPSEKSGTGCFAGRLLCTSNFPLCQRGPVISPTSKIIFFCDASIHVCSSYMSNFFTLL